ncbi:MAG: DUF1566 domain-containing protein [Candidatus Electrothrix aestuarii]|uniref:DUF1566 domain-containing protein n=1 Tax=Candidatus Electrothrix aestuarii TaxID=3062594 RepID=A0AAU8LUE7_9BACT|nr:DUF1566 domain-containing protein [Candidatus Electrothrix aestuarii]
MAEKRYAILIASSEYSAESGLSPLRCPEHDVDALDAILSSPDFGNFTETFVFRNAPSYEILPKLNSVLSNAGKDDLVLIYFSGHGKLNRLGHLCLATVNTDSKALEATSIRASTIKSYFDISYSRKKILLLDCCYSGAAGEEFVRTKGGVNEELQLMSSGQGTFIMTASSGIQTAVEKEGDQYGLFTKHLVVGIRSGEADKDEDGFVDMQELYEYVHEKVREDGAQEPMKWDLHVKGKLVVARSGKEAKERRRQEMERNLHRFAADGRLTSRIVGKAVQVISLPDKEMTAKDRECLLLIERLADERISTGDFVESWVKTCLPPELPPPPSPRLKLLLLILAAVSCAAAGAGWYFFREPPPASVVMPKMGKISVSWQPVPLLTQAGDLQPLLTLPLPPAMGKVSVSPQPVPSLSQINLQPLPKIDKMPQKNRRIGQYIDHGDGTITDTETGLMWKRCAEGLSGVNCEEGEMERYTWDEAVKRFKKIDYAGYADWRLPTIDELKTLLQCSKGKDKDGDCNDGSEKPTINQQAFPNTEAGRFFEAGQFWSGSPYAYLSDFAWFVGFNYGNSRAAFRNGVNAVRLVRGGQ